MQDCIFIDYGIGTMEHFCLRQMIRKQFFQHGIRVFKPDCAEPSVCGNQKQAVIDQIKRVQNRRSDLALLNQGTIPGIKNRNRVACGDDQIFII